MSGDRPHIFVDLARKAIRLYLEESKVCEIPEPLPEELKKQAGVFVSLKKNKQLRGCIGTFFPSQSCIAEEIIQNAISSATKDPRFLPVKKEELNDLEISVDVLSKPEKVESERELDPKRYGVIVSSGWKRGLLLPDLEGVNTVREQIEIAKRKAGILEDEIFEIMRFEVKRYKE